MNNAMKLTAIVCVIAVTFVVVNFFILKNQSLRIDNSPYAQSLKSWKQIND